MKNGTDFLFSCKNLYLASIHPFDFDKSSLIEYKQTLEFGKEILAQIGIQSFLGYLMESQYRVSVWASMIALEYGQPKENEILNFSGERTIIDSCLECIMQDEIEPLDEEIIANKKNWVQKNLPHRTS